MSDELSKRIAEADRIFGHFLPRVESVLKTRYAFPPEYLTEMEECLRVWFRAFARRPGSLATEEGTLSQVFLMACNAGQVFWAAQDEVPADEDLKRSLTLGPYQIMIELEHELELENGKKDGDGKKDGGDGSQEGS